MNVNKKHKVAVLVRKPFPPRWHVFAWCSADNLADAYEAADVVWRTQIQGRGVTAWTFAATEGAACLLLKDASLDTDEAEAMAKGGG